MFYCTDTSFVRWFVSSSERKSEIYTKCKNAENVRWNAVVALPQHTLLYSTNTYLWEFIHFATVIIQIFSSFYTKISTNAHKFSLVAISWLLTRKLFECNKSHVTQFKCEHFRFCWIVPADNHLFCCLCFQQLTRQQKIIVLH